VISIDPTRKGSLKLIPDRVFSGNDTKQGGYMGTREINEFLQQYFALIQDREEEIEFRLIHPFTGKVIREFITLDGLEDPSGLQVIERLWNLNQKEGYGLYFGTGTRKGGGKKEHVISLPGFWVDIDCGKKNEKHESQDHARTFMNNHLQDFPEPSLIINSGYGFHVYWLLNKPFRIPGEDTPENIDRFEGIEAGLLQRLQGDLQVKDISRVMRIPGTYNTKQKEYKPCFIERGNWDLQHDFEGFRGYYTPLEKVTIISPELQKEVDREGGEAVDMNEVKKRIRGPYWDMIKQGWGGDLHYKSRSEVDFAVIKELRRAGFPPGQVKWIFLNEFIGQKYREMKHPDNYLSFTISNADESLEQELTVEREKHAIIPNTLKVFWDMTEGTLTPEHITGEENIEVTNWVDSVFNTAGFTQTERADCIRYERNMGTYRQVMLFRKEEDLFTEGRKIDLGTMKRVYIAFMNEAITRKNYYFRMRKNDWKDFLNKFFGVKGIRFDKFWTALEDLSRAEKYDLIQKDGKTFLPSSSGGFLLYKALATGDIAFLVNPLYFPEAWGDLRQGFRIRGTGYAKEKLPFRKKPRKNLDRYEHETRGILRDMKVKKIYRTWDLETLFKRIGVKEYELKRKVYVKQIWDMVKRVLLEEGMEYQIDQNGKPGNIRKWTLLKVRVK